MKFTSLLIIFISITLRDIEAFALNHPLRGLNRRLFMSGIEVTMPALSSTMTEGRIVEWMKKEGKLMKRASSFVIYLLF